MSKSTSSFHTIRLSLADIVGKEYMKAVCQSHSCLSGEDWQVLLMSACRPVDWYPEGRHRRLLKHLPQVGQRLCAGTSVSAAGVTTQAFADASHCGMAPINGYGFYRMGENGCLYLLTKSEHYHAPLGHAFPGYALLDTARRLGIPNATHNNTRGHITRLLEERLLRAANGLQIDTSPALAPILDDKRLDCLNRVLNLETGSLAVEAGLKMMLARHYRVQADSPEPPYRGRTPVFLVMGNDDKGLLANYHGTTMLTQMLRGMWPDLYAGLEGLSLLRACPIRPNSIEDLEEAFARYERPPYKIAGFLHEIVMMNYGARLLSREFLQHAYSLCARHDVPVLVDEIQSCLWAPGLFLFKEYDLKPSFVALGKGFPGGEYPASRLLFSTAMDNLPQFGALVTNGQEELASLAYLITMHWALVNAEAIRRIGDNYEERLHELAARYPGIIAGIAGQRHLSGIEFHDLETARAFTNALNRSGFDISAQTYKAECPPVALTKIPLTACTTVTDFVIDRMSGVLDAIGCPG
ncbi:MAG: aminotransferase class III-fold pyridoxal phosphate-dependent enzyme [bacterium]|nr:aminotransferase class III-fold pyridoxal phosphate-dependent enzyme [bacterium]